MQTINNLQCTREKREKSRDGDNLFLSFDRCLKNAKKNSSTVCKRIFFMLSSATIYLMYFNLFNPGGAFQWIITV